MIFLARWQLFGCGILAIFLVVIATTVPTVKLLSGTVTTATDPTTTMNPMTTDQTIMDTTTMEVTTTDPTTLKPTTGAPRYQTIIYLVI